MNTASRKKKITIDILRIGQAQDLLSQAAQFGCNRTPITRGNRVVAALNGQFFDAIHQINDAGQRAHFTVETALHQTDVGQVILLPGLQGLEPLYGGHLIGLVAGAYDLLAAGHLRLRFDQTALQVAHLIGGPVKEKAIGYFHRGYPEAY